jgi:hypothetical protein
MHEWPIPPSEKPKAARRFKSSLSRVWNEMRAEAAGGERQGAGDASGQQTLDSLR